MTYFVNAQRKRLQAKKMLKKMFNGSPSTVVAGKEGGGEARKASAAAPSTLPTSSTKADGEEDPKSQFFADDGAFQ